MYGVLLVRRVVRALDHDEVAAREGGRGVAAPDLPMGHDLARQQRLLHVQERGEGLVVHDDGGQRRLGGLGGLRGHEGHALSDVAHELRGQHRPVGLDERDQVLPGDLLRRDDRAHAG
jgi:hypothetical protein